MSVLIVAGAASSTPLSVGALVGHQGVRGGAASRRWLWTIRRRTTPRSYDDNGGTVVAVAGDDYCVVAASTRMSTGYSILTRQKTKVLQL